MSPEERRGRGTELCQRLTQGVEEIAPPGIGHWDRTWEIVDPADAEFMVALSAWESEPTPDALATVTAAYDAVLVAWKDAVTRFHQHVQETA